MNESAIELNSISKNYKSTPVIKELHLIVPRNSIMGLLGKNGAGKTTLIECALGLLRLDSGSARILGEPSWNLSAAAKAKIGYVPQIPVHYGFMSVRQTLDYTSAFYPRWNNALIQRLLSEWELNPAERTGKLSAGQQQKLSILMAMGHEPELLVLDEPVASLDPFARRDFLRALLDIALTGERTVLFSTHITSDLERVADRVAILKGGQIAFCGELDRLKDDVKRLRISRETDFPRDFTVQGMLHCNVVGAVAKMTVRNFTSEMINQIMKDWSATVEVQDLNLEEIFLELHHAQ